MLQKRIKHQVILKGLPGKVTFNRECSCHARESHYEEERPWEKKQDEKLSLTPLTANSSPAAVQASLYLTMSIFAITYWHDCFMIDCLPQESMSFLNGQKTYIYSWLTTETPVLGVDLPPSRSSITTQQMSNQKDTESSHVLSCGWAQTKRIIKQVLYYLFS